MPSAPVARALALSLQKVKLRPATQSAVGVKASASDLSSLRGTCTWLDLLEPREAGVVLADDSRYACEACEALRQQADCPVA